MGDARRLRPGPGRRDPHGGSADDRDHPQPGGARRRGAAGGRHPAQGSTQRQADGADPQRLQRYAGPTSRASRPTLTSPASRGGKLNLTALEDDDRNLALCQGLLLLDVGHEALELFPFLGGSGPRADFELVGTNLDRRDWARQQILVPAGMRWGAVPGRNDDVAIAIFPEAENRYAFLAGFCAGRRP